MRHVTASRCVTLRERLPSKTRNTGPDPRGLTSVKYRADGVATLRAMCSKERQDAAGVEMLSPAEAASLLRQARALTDAGMAEPPLLAGKQLALLSTDCADAPARDFTRAATLLGAHVACVQPGLDEHSSPAQIDALARVLGRLYDAVECQHMPDGLVRRLARHAGIPVFAGLATAAHPTAALAAGLDPGMSWPTRRRCILQAALLASVA
jgi:ornithine carbamoyltransferase